MVVFAVEKKMDPFDATVQLDIGAMVVTPSVPYRVRIVVIVCVSTVVEESNVNVSMDMRGTCVKMCRSMKWMCPSFVRHLLSVDIWSLSVPRPQFGLSSGWYH
jgi:hypothetical protein